MTLTRRDVIKAGLAAPLAALAGTEPTYAYVSPAVIIAAIGLFVNMLQSQRGDGGTGAILSAINGKVDIIISQLASVQLALAQITDQIAQVKEDVLEAIGEQYAIEKFNETKAGLVAITDVQRDAKNKGISLQMGTDRRGLERDLEDAWKEFDQSRRRLREYDQGRGLVSVALLDAIVLADASAFAAGIIDETRFAIILGHHLDWIDTMVDPKLEFSVASFANKAKEEEATARKLIDSGAKNRTDAVSIIAAALLVEQSVQICTITSMDVEYWSEFPSRQWNWLRGNEYLMVPTYNVQHANRHGVIIYENVMYDQNYQAKVTIGESHIRRSHILWQTPDASKVDTGKCRKFSNGEIHLLAQDSFNGHFENEAGVDFDKGIQPFIIGNFIDRSTFARAISSNGKESANAVQLLLDRINLQVLNQRLAQLATETIAGNRSFAEMLAAALPTIPRDQP